MQNYHKDSQPSPRVKYTFPHPLATIPLICTYEEVVVLYVFWQVGAVVWQSDVVQVSVLPTDP